MRQSSSRPLKQAVNHHLDEIKLSEDRLTDLESLMGFSGEKKARDESWSNTVYVAAAAVFALVFVVTAIFDNQAVNIPQRIAEEVVHNHLKLKPLEVETDSIEGVRQYFAKLDFMPANSRLIKESGLALIGGRYCSLQGITAAQLRLKANDSASVQTFYQAEYRKEVFGDLPNIEQGDAPVEVYVKGVKVKIWLEKGLVFALTETPS